jgi:hypothetical protein
MKVGIDVLMIILLIVFIGSFVTLMIFGEVWDINLSMADRHIESFDRGRTMNAFIASCFCIASGASMLYIVETRFPQGEKTDTTHPQTIPHS